MSSRTDKMSAGNTRGAYMREYRERKWLEDDSCNNVPELHKKFVKCLSFWLGEVVRICQS
jgi:hypothetical protein